MGKLNIYPMQNYQNIIFTKSCKLLLFLLTPLKHGKIEFILM